jgi:hypothetical protein
MGIARVVWGRLPAIAVVVLATLGGAASFTVSGADGPGGPETEAEQEAAPPPPPFISGGFDISWPQCGKNYPPGPVAFTVVGLNGGKPFTSNPCFAHEYRWAQRVERHPMIYINVAYPKPGVPEAITGPEGTCEETNEMCRAYNYGWNLAAHSVQLALLHGITPTVWWLDVEVNNYWSEDKAANAQVVRAAVLYLQSLGIPFGIYGTPYQWNLLVGDYAPGVPIWTAGADNVDDAMSRCTNPKYAFAGGEVVMAQYYPYGFDGNVICPAFHKYFPAPEPATEHGLLARSTHQEGVPLPFWWAIPQLAFD